MEAEIERLNKLLLERDAENVSLRADVNSLKTQLERCSDIFSHIHGIALHGMETADGK